jgi:hypothetical protein
MESCVKAIGFSLVVAVCAVLSAGPGRAQEDAPKAGSDHDAPRAGIGDGGTVVGGADTKRSDSVGNRGAGQNQPAEGDMAHPGLPSHAGPGADASRKGTAAPMGALGATSGNQGAALEPGVAPVRLDSGLTGLQRRAIRKVLTANAPKQLAAPSVNVTAAAPVTRPGADGGAMRNAIGVVVTGGQGARGAVAGLTAHAGTGASGQGPGATGVGVAAGNVGGVDGRRPALPLGAVTGPTAQATGINGTTMGHIASGPGYIGGPAKDRSGINGTAVRPKH